MAADVFVQWKTAKKPTREEAEKVIQDFFGGAATEIRWDNDRFFITLVGKWSHPLSRVVDEDIHQTLKGMERTLPDEGRYLEVWLGSGSLDVISRRQDEFVHACQDGLAAVFARFWDGKIEK